jgi:hypothetical protein
VDRRVVRDLKRGPSPRTQHAADLAHVAERDRRVRDVLEDDMGDHRVRALRRDAGERLAVAEQPLYVSELGVMPPGGIEHAR